MVMKKIGFSKLHGNLASASLAIKMHDGKIIGEPFFCDKLDELKKACNPDRSISVAYLVLNAYHWGQEYQASLNNQEVR